MKKYSIGVVLIVIVGIIVFLSLQEKEKVYSYTTAQKTNLVQKVSVTGRVKPINQVDLTFEQNGKIEDVNVEVGDRVVANQVLVTMSSQELWADLAQVNADVDMAQAQLREAERGTRNEQIDIQKQQLRASKTSVEDAKINVWDSIQKSFTQADYALRNKIDPLFYNARNNNVSPRLKIKNNYRLETTDINNMRQKIEWEFQKWRKKLNESENKEEVKIFAEYSKEKLYQGKEFLDTMAYVMNDTRPYSGVSQSDIDGYKSSISTARTSIDNAISNIALSLEKLNAAEQSSRVVEKQVVLEESGNTEEQIAIAHARVKSAQARKQRVQAQINKTKLKAPFKGIITKQEAQKGEIISLMTAKEILVSMVGEGYEIEINVPEVDVSKIKIGDTVEIEFDAFEDEMFESTVTFIEPAETIVQGVVYYQVKVALDLETIPLEIRSGMSVDVDIITDSRENVLALPQRVVIKKDGDRYVQILREESESGEKMVEEVSVETGLRGSNGKIEIVSGIQEGEKILTSYNEE